MTYGVRTEEKCDKDHVNTPNHTNDMPHTPPQAMAILSCVLCHSNATSLVSNVDRYKKPLKTVICKGCGLVYTQQNRITDIKHFYGKEYRGRVSKPPLRHVIRHGRNALTRYEKLKPYLLPEQKILDIGSGNGEFVYLLAYLGYKAKGIEPHEGLATYSKTQFDLDIEISFFEDFAQSCTETFDVVTLFHVLEHKENPAKTLSLIHHLLKPEGLCVIEVPDISSHSIAPRNIFHIEHIFNFNKTTLDLLGQKTGFTLINTFYSKVEGNITVILKKSNCSENSTIHAPENYEQLYKKLKTHTNLIHYCTPMPYVRFIQKGLRYIQEHLYTAQFDDEKILLDALYQAQTKKHLKRH